MEAVYASRDLHHQLLGAAAARTGHPLRGELIIAATERKGVLRLLTLQPPGKKAMSVTDLLNSRRDWFEPGTQLN